MRKLSAGFRACSICNTAYPENIKPTDNFCVTSTGITFLYTPYEIGVYAVGMPRIEMPYSSIDELLR